MTVKEKRELRKNLKREKIIENASLLFSVKNYHEVMMEDVAKLTSVAKGTVYNYFSSKEELYFSIIRLRMNKLLDSLEKSTGSRINAADSLRSFVVLLYKFMISHRNFFLMYMKESLKNDNEICQELRESESHLRSILAGIIKSGNDEGVFRHIDGKLAVSIVLGSIYGAVQKAIDENYREEDAMNEKDNVFGFILNGLQPDNIGKEILPLKNKTIVITRTVEQSGESSDLFTRLGADVIIFPTLEIVPPSSWEPFDDVIKGKQKIDYIIFTSAHSVRMFKRRCEELNTIIDFEKSTVIAVGNKTANVCAELNIPVHIIPRKFSGEGVVDELSNHDLKNKIVFIPRSLIGRETLPAGLREQGAVLKAVPVYNVTIPSEDNIRIYRDKLNSSRPDLFIFTSPSTFENFIQILNISDPVKYFNGYKVAAIGPTTKAAIEEKKVKVDIMPEEFTIDGLAKAIVGFYN